MFMTHFRAHKRGAASVEALIIITFLILVWTGVRHMGTVAGLSLKGRAEARGCAFYVATHGCRNVPDWCHVDRDSEPSPTEEEETASLDEKASEVGAIEGDDADESSGFGNKVGNFLDETLQSTLFERAEAHVPQSIEAPPLLGGETVELSQDMSLPCNPVHESLDDKLLGIFADLFNPFSKD